MLIAIQCSFESVALSGPSMATATTTSIFNWRDHVLSRRSGATFPASPFVKAAPTFARYATESLLLSGADVYKLETLCTNTVHYASAVVVFRRWLAKHEKRRMRRDIPVRELYAEYHASRLQRMFLRRILLHMKQVVCAGGYPAAMLCKVRGLPSWTPCDVDIFCYTEEDMVAAAKLFDHTVALNMGSAVQISTWMTSDVGVHQDPAERDMTINAVPENAGRYSQMDTEPIAQHPWTVATLRPLITNWCSSNPARKHIAHFRQHTTARDGTDRHCFEAFMRELQRTDQHLPERLEAPLNRVLYTHKLHVKNIGLLRHSSNCVTPVNLIRMQVPTGMGVSGNFVARCRQQLCEGFDMTLCSVALTHVESDLSLHDSAFWSYNGASEALTARKVVLTSTAFACQDHLIAWQMSRISKYLARQFHW